MPYETHELEELAGQMTGGFTEDIREACEMWQNERRALQEFADENQALIILNRRIRLVNALAFRAMSSLMNDAQMFITPRTRAEVDRFRDQYTRTENAIVQSKLLVDAANERKAAGEQK